MIGVGGSTGIRTPKTSCSRAVSSSDCGDGNASEPMQHIDQRGFLGRLRRALLVAVGLEEPILGRSLDPQPGGRQAVRGHLDIGLSHDKIDIVARLRPAGYPEGIATAQREGDAVGFQG